MKKTTKKLAVACLALLSCAAIGAATGCSEGYMGALGNHVNGLISGITHEHEYVLKYDANNHWKECECGEKEAAAEILLEAKGFTDVVVSINGDAVDVVVNEASLDDVMRAQIEDIEKRKTGVEASNIIISTVVP